MRWQMTYVTKQWMNLKNRANEFSYISGHIAIKLGNKNKKQGTRTQHHPPI